MKDMFLFVILLHQVYAAGFQVHPGTIFEDVGNTKFIHSYLDLRLDLSCSYNVSQQILYLNNSLHSIHLFINNTLHNKHLVYNTSNAVMAVSKLDNIHIIAKLSVHQQNLLLLQSKYASTIKFKLNVLF